jgi:hypothetical protein
MDSPMAGGLGGPAGGDGNSDDSEEESAESVAALLGLISTGGLSTELIIDDPVTSGSDSSQWNCPQSERSDGCAGELEPGSK